MNSPIPDYLILGAGGHARVIADALLATLGCGQSGRFLGFLDDDPKYEGQNLFGFPVLGPLRKLREIPSPEVIIGIGDNRVRRDLYESLSGAGVAFARVIHPSSVVGREVEVGPASFLAAGVIVNSGTRIGENSILNTGSSVDHDCRIGPHSHLAPGVHLGGHVSVGAESLVGIGSVVVPGVQIGRQVVVAAGAVVIRDVTDRLRVQGVPARPLH